MQFEDSLDHSQDRGPFAFGSVRLAILIGRTAARRALAMWLPPPWLKVATIAATPAPPARTPPSPTTARATVVRRPVIGRPTFRAGGTGRTIHFSGIGWAALLGLIIRVKKTAFVLEDNIVGGAVTLFCHKLRDFERKKRGSHHGAQSVRPGLPQNPNGPYWRTQ
jgi:hypothetical protein